MAVGQLAVDLTREGRRDPVAIARWLSGLVGAVAELGFQASLDLVRPTDAAFEREGAPVATHAV
jgi:hypothetical protein